MLFILFIACCVCYNIDPKEISVTGFSAGGYFGVQFQVAYSSILKGAGISAGGCYYCAKDSEMKALETCMSMCELIVVEDLIYYAKKFAAAGEIDDLSNLANHKTYLYSGMMDMTVHQKCMKKLYTMYDRMAQCLMSMSPFIDNCNYDEAYNILRKIYDLTMTKLIQRMKISRVLINQSTVPNIQKAKSWDTTGYAYVPTNCVNNTCALHVVFHGCTQYYGSIGDTFIKYAGFNRWAESNDIIVVYPQTTSEMMKNPNGCFDWWGYTGSDYAYKTGSQMAATKAIIDDFSKTDFLL